MSTILTLRRAIRTKLVDADVLPHAQIFVERHRDEQTKLLTLLGTCKNGVALAIADAGGTRTDDTVLSANLSIALVLYASNSAATGKPNVDGSLVEIEEIWEKMVVAIDDRHMPVGGFNGYLYTRLKLQNWTHIADAAAGNCYAIQTLFATQITIPRS